MDGHWKRFELLESLKHMAYPPTRESQLFAAALRGDNDAVARFIRTGADAATAIDHATGWSAVAAALVGGNGTIADLLLDNG